MFDKDNCLTLPHEDRLVPELKDTWEECRTVFGAENILIVSNTAGTRWDAGGIKAESVSHKLGASVLFHSSLKPGYSCIRDIRAYFSSLPRPVSDRELIVVGDRILTDVVLANRMRSSRKADRHADSFNESKLQDSNPEGPLAIYVDKVWKKDATVLRVLERSLLRLTERYALSEEEKEARHKMSKSFIRYTA